jgi:hypothetical protein
MRRSMTCWVHCQQNWAMTVRISDASQAAHKLGAHSGPPAGFCLAVWEAGNTV